MAIYKNSRPFGNIVTDGLVLNLDATNINSYPGSGTTWTDTSFYRNNATLVNGPTFLQERGRGSVVFDGVDDYATLSTNIGVSNLPAFSVSFWAKKSAASTTSTIYAEGTPASWPGNLFIVYFGTTEDSGKCRVWFGYPTVQSPLIGTTNVTDGKWYYVTYNQTNNSNRKLYVNTVVEATNTTTISSTATNSYIGYNNNNGTLTQFNQGSLSYLACYNRGLSDSEIIQNYNALKSRFGL